MAIELTHPDREIKRMLQGNNTLFELDAIRAGRFLHIEGHLDQALLSYDQKHPLIMAGNDRITSLFIQQAHHKTYHGGIQDTLIV